MSEKSANDARKDNDPISKMNRRDYLKLAGITGSSFGTGISASILNNEIATPVRAATTVVDDFSDSNLDGRYIFAERTANTSTTTISTAVTEGADKNVLQMKDDGTTKMHAYDGDGDTQLGAYPEIGNTFSYWVRGLNGTENMNFIYGAKDKDNKYYVKLNLDTGALGLFKRVDGSGLSLTGDWSNSNLQGNTGWFKIEIEWTTNHDHTIRIYQNGAEITSISYSETSSDPQFTANGTGFAGYLSSGETAQFDYAVVGSPSPKYKISQVDDFEVADNDLSAYRFDEGSSAAEIVADTETSATNVHGPTYSGTRALKISDSSATEMISTPGDGLETYPEAGDIVKCYIKATGGADNFNFTWGVQDRNNRYYAKVKPESDVMYFFKYKEGSGEVLAKTSNLSMNQGTWYYLEVEWGADGSQTVELYDLEGNELAKCSETDSEWTSGGIGFDAYLDSGETVYFDECAIVEEKDPVAGGWGPDHLTSYNAEPVDRAVSGDWDKIDDFRFYLNYEGPSKVKKDGEIQSIIHRFQLSALFNTYYREAGFEYDPVPEELDPIETQGRAKIRADVVQNESNTSLTSADDKNTWALAVGPDTWSQWKNNDSNWDTEDGFEEFKNKAVKNSPVESNDSDHIKKALWYGFNTVLSLTAPGGVGLAISTAEFLADLAYNPDSNCYDGGPKTDGDKSGYELTEWDWCNKKVMAVSMRSLEVEVDYDSGTTYVDAFHGVLPEENFTAENVCNWYLECPSTKKNATFTVDKYSGGIPPEL